MKEQLQIAISGLQIEKIGDATLNDINEEWLEKQLKDYEKNLEEDTETNGKIITIKKNDNIGKFLIDEKLNIIELETTGIILSYKATSVNESNANIVITVIAMEDKIQTIEIDENQIENVKGKESINIDYTVQLSKEYTIKVISEKGIEKQDIINIKIPKTPIIPDITLSYPVVTLNEVKAPMEEIEIEYDDSEDIINYYSLDNGLTWEKYTGRITVQSGTEKVKAKSEYKKYTGINSESEKDVKIEEKYNTLKQESYDKNLETSVTYDNHRQSIPDLPIHINGFSTRFYVDETTWWNKLKINYELRQGGLWKNFIQCVFLDENNNLIDLYNFDDIVINVKSENESIWIPEGTKSIFMWSEGSFDIYELSIVKDVDGNEFWPVFTKNMNSGIRLSASSEFSDNATYTACDSNDATSWVPDSGNYGPHEFKIEFRTPKIVSKYYLKGAHSWGTEFKFYLEASNDDENWIKLEGDTVHDGNINGERTPGEYNIDLQNQTAYKYYRVYFPQGGWTYGRSGGAAIVELKLFEKE